MPNVAMRWINPATSPAKLSDRQIAEHVGVVHVMVSRYRKDLESTVSLEQSDERTGRDGRTINTANIGKRAAEEIERQAKERMKAGGGDQKSTKARER